ncbi:MAG: hypothetical protein JXR23_05655 [Pontiellaceae bacterium]|nr:hypothetical protein [Pontiellaceae bacterium]
MADGNGEVFCRYGKCETMRHVITYHGALAPINEACEIGGYLCVSHLMANPRNRTGFLRQLSVAWRHLSLVFLPVRHGGKKLILVRDFSNIPLAVVFPLIRWGRRELIFLINHNLQWALDSQSERKALHRLQKMGARFAFLEQVPRNVLQEVGLNDRSCYALSHPVPENSIIRRRMGGVHTVGIVGQYRPEKGTDKLLEALKPLADQYRLVLAIPNSEEFKSRSRFGQADWFERIDTSDINDYRLRLADCDVVVLNYPSDHYSCRASGLIADAAAAHVPVLVRNLPILKHQVEYPVRIGETFDQLDELFSCIKRVSMRLDQGEYDFESYKAGRSVSALLEQIRKMTV